MILDVYLMSTFSSRLPVISCATVIAAALISGNSILFSSRSQIKGLTTSAGLWACSILGFAIGAGLYTVTLIVFLFLICILACFPSVEAYLKNRSNHFEIHLELKSCEYLRDFVTVSRRLGLRIDDIEANQAVIVRRDTREKIVVSLDEIETKLGEVFETMQHDMLEKARPTKR